MKKLALDQTQKVAVARIVSELIEADFIVEEREMLFFEDIISNNGLKISKNMLIEGKQMKLDKAIAVLKELDEKDQKQIIQLLKRLALSDGTCVPLEAILIFAIELAMEQNAYIYSVPANDVGINNMTVIYVENEDETRISRMIESNYRTISNDFAMAGFEFVHIPFVVDDYRKMDAEYLNKVVRYMIPSIPQDKVDCICNDLQNMTTSRFCRDLLYKKIRIPLLDVGPSLLIKIGESSLVETYGRDDAERTNYANFLRIDLKGNVMRSIRGLIDTYHSMINCPITVSSVPKNYKFAYFGFHRSLFDLIAYGREQREYTLFFDLTGSKTRVYFEPVDGNDERIPIRLTPQETALYLMIVKKSFDGNGLDCSEDIDADLKKEILAEYNKIYSRIGSSKVLEYKDRTQVNHIKSRVLVNKCIANVELFVPEHIKDGKISLYRVHASPKHVRIIEKP